MIRPSCSRAFQAASLALLCFPLSGLGADWPQYRGPDRDGVAAEDSLILPWPDLGPERLWTADVGTGVSAFVVAEGKAFTMGNTGREDIVYAFDADTGEELWTYSYRCPKDPRQFQGGPASTPTYADGILFTLSHRGHLKAINARTGELGWEKHLVDDLGGDRPRWGYAGTPLVIEDRVIVEPGGGAGSLVALDKKTGSVLWRGGDEGAAYSSPILYRNGNEEMLLAFNAYGIVGYALENGEELWKSRWETSYDVNAAVPIVFGDRVFISSGYGSGSSVLELAGSSSPRRVWANDDFMNQLTSSVIVNGHAYGFHVWHIGRRGGHYLKCVDLDTGEVVWREDSLGAGQLIRVGENLVILTERGELVIAEATPRGYREKERMQVLGGQSWVEPAYANGILYVRNNEGKAAAYRIGEGDG